MKKVISFIGAFLCFTLAMILIVLTYKEEIDGAGLDISLLVFVGLMAAWDFYARVKL